MCSFILNGKKSKFSQGIYMIFKLIINVHCGLLMYDQWSQDTQSVHNKLHIVYLNNKLRGSFHLCLH